MFHRETDATQNSSFVKRFTSNVCKLLTIHYSPLTIL
jgi:hypothetical protein